MPLTRLMNRVCFSLPLLSFPALRAGMCWQLPLELLRLSHQTCLNYNAQTKAAPHWSELLGPACISCALRWRMNRTSFSSSGMLRAPERSMSTWRASGGVGSLGGKGSRFRREHRIIKGCGVVAGVGPELGP